MSLKSMTQCNHTARTAGMAGAPTGKLILFSFLHNYFEPDTENQQNMNQHFKNALLIWILKQIAFIAY